jgi:hypothetical protein
MAKAAANNGARYRVVDWQGAVPWLVRQDGIFLVDRRFINDFLYLMGERGHAPVRLA